jgi:hypothetical protein
MGKPGRGSARNRALLQARSPRIVPFPGSLPRQSQFEIQGRTRAVEISWSNETRETKDQA